MLFRCPFCGKEVGEDDTGFYCNYCMMSVEPDIFEEVKVCPDCDNELEVIISCGVDDYYCEKCKKTVNKKEVKKEYRKI